MEFEDGYRLTEEEITSAGPVIESGPSIVTPTRGGREKSIFEWDGQTQEGSVKLAVIRPCVSRGKRIRGLPPIYTQEMLAENAAVYSGWLMYMDHFTKRMREALEEVLQESGGRSITELGGRILRSWYEPNYRAAWDDNRGYYPGAVLAEALPQPTTRAMLEADPEILNVSHNAWPSGAVVGTHWGKKGAIIEGIRKEPEGSVDWVPRGGAGGQIAEGVEEVAVSILRSCNASDAMFDWKNVKDAGALIEEMKQNAPSLLEEMGGEDKVRSLIGSAQSNGTVDASQIKIVVREALAEAGVEAKTDDDEKETPEEIAERIIAERKAQEQLAEAAHEIIEGAGLPRTMESDMKTRYCVLPSGASQAIKLVEAQAEKDSKEPKDVLREAIEADLKHAVKIIEESGGTVRVRGLGAEKPDPEGDGKSVGKDQKFGSWVESIGGVKSLKEDDKESDLVTEMLEEGAAA